MFLYFDFLSSCFMYLIQEFWFVAVDRGGQDGDLALVADLLAEQVNLAGPDLLGVGLVDEQVVLAGDVRVRTRPP